MSDTIRTSNTQVIYTLENRVKELMHQEWLLKMELEGYRELCKIQEFIIDELKVAQSQE